MSDTTVELNASLKMVTEPPTPSVDNDVTNAFRTVANGYPLVPSDDTEPEPSTDSNVIRASGTQVCYGTVSLGPDGYTQPLEPEHSVSTTDLTSSQPTPVVTG